MSFYDRLASIYDSQYSEEQRAKMRKVLAKTRISQFDLILDMGCGTGLLFEHIGKGAQLVLGIDTSSRILLKAKDRLKQLRNAAIIRADVDYTPFRNQTFDQVFAITLLQNMPTPSRTIQEMKRISKPRSTIILTGLKKTFTEKSLKELLEKTSLKPCILDSNPQLSDHLAICKRE